jgi:flagellar biosynthesis GTPase FlhF
MIKDSEDEKVYFSDGEDAERDELLDSEFEVPFSVPPPSPKTENQVEQREEEEEDDDDEDYNEDTEEEDDDDTEEEDTEEEEEEQEEERKAEEEEVEEEEDQECPPPPEQKAIMKKLESTRTGLREGDIWYLVDLQWFTNWKRHVKYDWVYDVTVSQPGEIDNSHLLIEETDMLKPGLFENQDFTVLPAKEWKKLVSWYVDFNFISVF